MAERIEITDPKLAARVESTIAELRQYYPDGVIKSLQAQHKTLSKWVAKLWKEVGYESREDFLSAYGFEGSKAGGQAKWTRESAEEMFSELARRYEGKEKPRDIEELKEQNPDFSGSSVVCVGQYQTKAQMTYE